MTPEQIRNELDQDSPRSSFPQYHVQSRQDRDAELVAFDQMSLENARNATESDDQGSRALPDATGASEALVQQVADRDSLRLRFARAIATDYNAPLTGSADSVMAVHDELVAAAVSEAQADTVPRVAFDLIAEDANLFRAEVESLKTEVESLAKRLVVATEVIMNAKDRMRAQRGEAVTVVACGSTEDYAKAFNDGFARALELVREDLDKYVDPDDDADHAAILHDYAMHLDTWRRAADGEGRP